MVLRGNLLRRTGEAAENACWVARYLDGCFVRESWYEGVLLRFKRCLPFLRFAVL